MKKNEINEQIESKQQIIQDEIENVLSNGFGRYSKYVLQDRAVPDVRDGLKPVQRRIIYTMYLEGNFSNKPTRKCARTVGVVIGRFHPHGDSSVYEAMVRLSQDWKMRVPLIDFQGNNGSIDGDGAAAYRYTEARLSEISSLMIEDLNKDTVDMELNFDDQEYEPTVLPSRFPNILVNGSQGIGIGSSTDIPPHNLSEVIDATIYRINHKRCTVDDLMQFIKGPDFPTGGIITNPQDLKQIYETGNGTIKLMCSTHIDEFKSYSQIVIDEIPFGIDKASLVQKIAKFKIDNNIDAIMDVRDETDKDGIRICIDIKKDSNPETILKYIISKNVLTNTIKFNMLVIDHFRPSTLSLLRTLDCYIEHQKDVITRRTKHDLEKFSARLHIVEGLIKAMSILDEVIKTIRGSENKQDAKEKLMKNFAFSEKQAEALLMMQLYRLTNIDVTTLINEGDELRKDIKELNLLLSSDERMNHLLSTDLKEIKKKFDTPRLTKLQDNQIDLTIDPKQLISKEETMVIFTHDGYVKRSSLKSYNSSSDSLPGLKDGDSIRGITKANTTDTLLLFTTLGNYLSIPVYKIFDNKWKEEGKHINEIGSVSNAEKIVSGVIISTYKEGINVVLCSKYGAIKRTSIIEFETTRIARSSKCFNLSKDDEIISVSISNGNNNILVCNSLGQASLYHEKDISLVQLKAGGIKAMNKVDASNPIVDMLVFDQKETTRLGLLTREHGARLIDYSQIQISNRLDTKISLFKSFKYEPHRLLGVFKFNKKQDEMHVSIVLANKVRATCKFENTKLLPLESYLKNNCDYGSDELVVDCCRLYVPQVNENTEVFLPKKQEEIVNTQPEYEQLSLFEYIDDED